MADIWDALFWAVVAAGWPGLLAVSAFAVYRSVRFYRSVRRSAPGLLVLLTVVGWVTTLIGVALVSTFYLLQSPANAGPVVLPVFLLWAGSMVVIVWVVQRWGHEALALDAYYGELEHMDKMRTRFINHVAHELNTPIMPLQVQASMLRDGKLGELSERQHKAVDVIARNLDRLEYLVEMVVMASRLQGGGVVPDTRTVPLQDLLPQDKDGVEIRGGAGRIEGQVDPKHGRFIAGQVLALAARHETPWIEVVGRHSAVQSILEFRFPEQVDPHLFEPFREPADLYQEEQYVGLELFIARGLAELNGGSLTTRGDSGRVLEWRMPGPAHAGPS